MGKECKLVQDLLPTYIENMTSEETKNFIEEHLKECKECKEIFESMKQDLDKQSVKDTEVVKEVKKYKRKLFTLKSIIIILVLAILISWIGYFGFRFYVVNKAFEKNTNYDIGGNFTVHEYIDSVERDENHFITYYNHGKTKTVYGEILLEYDDGDKHYYFNNEDMTYYVEDSYVEDKLNINISLLSGMENIVKDGKIDKLEVLKYVIFQKDVYIHEEGFRNQKYYIIKNLDGEKIYLDKDTFFVARINADELKGGKSGILKSNVSNSRDYRVVTANVGWREVQMPDISKYTLVEK